MALKILGEILTGASVVAGAVIVMGLPLLIYLWKEAGKPKRKGEKRCGLKQKTIRWSRTIRTSGTLRNGKMSSLPQRNQRRTVRYGSCRSRTRGRLG